MIQNFLVHCLLFACFPLWRLTSQLGLVYLSTVFSVPKLNALKKKFLEENAAIHANTRKTNEGLLNMHKVSQNIMHTWQH